MSNSRFLVPRRRVGIAKAQKKSLLVYRPVLNGRQIAAWARGAGVEDVQSPERMAVIIAFSLEPVNWQGIRDDHERYSSPQINYAGSSGRQDPPGSLRVTGGMREIDDREDGSVCLVFESLDLVERWLTFRRAGASWPDCSFEPCLPLGSGYDGEFDAATPPYQQDILLGDEVWEEIPDDTEIPEELIDD